MAGILRASGHEVFAPSYTGMGDRSHLLTPGITIETFVLDLVEVIESNELTSDQFVLDERMLALDGTVNLSRLGANAVLATSLAVCRAAAIAQGVQLYRYIGTLAGNRSPTLPMPMVNILSGGAHAARSMDLQDFLAVPVGTRVLEMRCIWFRVSGVPPRK